MHHQNRIFRDGQRLRIGGLEIDDQRRLAGVGRRVDPCVDAARRRGGDGRVAAPVESGGEAAVHFGARDDRGREGEQGHAEAQRIGIPVGHAGRGRGDADGVDFALEPRPMGRPKGLGARIAVVVGERIGERGGGTVAHLRVAVEPGQDVARRGPTQSQRAAIGRLRRRARTGRRRRCGRTRARTARRPPMRRRETGSRPRAQRRAVATRARPEARVAPRPRAPRAFRRRSMGCPGPSPRCRHPCLLVRLCANALRASFRPKRRKGTPDARFPLPVNPHSNQVGTVSRPINSLISPPWPHDRVFRAFHQHFGNEQAGIVGSGLYGAIGAGAHHRDEIARGKFRQVAVKRQIIAAFADRADYVASRQISAGVRLALTGRIS